jgi:hypothetical protein
VEKEARMAFLEYMLLALLGSAGAAAPGGTPVVPVARTFSADAVTQPTGGTEGEGISVLGQCTGRGIFKTSGASGKKSTNPQAARKHYRRGHRHAKVTTSGKKATKE